MNLDKMERIFPSLKEYIINFKRQQKQLNDIDAAITSAKGFDPNGYWHIGTENEARSWTIVKKVGNIHELIRDYSGYADYGRVFVTRLEDMLLPEEAEDKKVNGPRRAKDNITVHFFRGNVYKPTEVFAGVILNAPEWFVIRHTDPITNAITYEA